MKLPGLSHGEITGIKWPIMKIDYSTCRDARNYREREREGEKMYVCVIDAKNSPMTSKIVR